MPFFGLGKWDLLHWEWDLTTGKGIKNFENGNGISLLYWSPTLLFDTTSQMSLFFKIRK